ncbi:MAG: DUF4124 domain-containing protein [Gammaproteobacteria bacterium]|nr:DUF4124 domain-containing protein [Gammaproteobacteria bacterium]
MRPNLIAFIAAALVALGTVAEAGPTYRWVDDQGVVHYGDRVPPEYADQRSDVLNRHGVPVGSRDGLLSEEERAAEQREAEAQAERIAQQRRDRVLLDTYISVDEIRMLRDRRLEMLQAQLDVTAGTLERLYQQLHELEMLAAEYQPHNDDPDAPRIPDDLANDLASTQSSVLNYERTLDNARQEQARVMERFAEDISRFEELQAQRRTRLR